MNYVDKADQNGYTQTVILLKQIFCRCGSAFGRFDLRQGAAHRQKAVRQGGVNGHGTPHPCRFFRKGQTDMKAVLIPGDGIGPEVSGAATAGAALSTGAAAFLAGAFLAAAASALARSSAPKRSSNFLTTGGSTLDDAALTYSPMSVSIVITSALLMPYSCASCETRIFAGGATFSSWSSTGGGRGPLVGLHAHREVLIAGS